MHESVLLVIICEAKRLFCDFALFLEANYKINSDFATVPRDVEHYFSKTKTTLLA